MSTTQSQFYEWFHKKADELRNEIANCKSSSDESQCLKLLSELSATCKSERHKLTKHDQKIYTQELDKIRDDISQSRSNRPKISLFAKRLETKKVESIPVQVEPEKLPLSNHLSGEEQRRHPLRTDEILCYNGGKESISLESLKSCVVLISGDVGSVALVDIVGSVIFLPSVNGPIHASGLNNTVIITLCHQFRMHSSELVDVYIGCKQPIIEGCHHIRFHEYPSRLVVPKKSVAHEEPLKWESIVDFDSLGSMSDNWSQIDGQGLTTFEWSLLSSLNVGDFERKKILKELLPSSDHSDINSL